MKIDSTYIIDVHAEGFAIAFAFLQYLESLHASCPDRVKTALDEGFGEGKTPTIIEIKSAVTKVRSIYNSLNKAIIRANHFGRSSDIILIIFYNSSLSLMEELNLLLGIDHRTYMQNRFNSSLSESKQDNIRQDTVRAEALVWAYQQRLQLLEAGEKDSRMQRARDVIGRALGVSGDAIEKSVARIRKKSVELLHYDPLIARFTRPQFAAVLDGLPRARGAPRNSDKSSPFRSVLE